jgi:polyhydroxyalkanoate synthesis regulator phasin
MTIDELKDYIDERTRDMETHLLSEFRKWAVRIEGSLRVQSTQVTVLTERVTLLEERLDKLETDNQ